MTQRDRSWRWGHTHFSCVVGLLASSAFWGACNKPNAGPGLEPPAPAQDAGQERDGAAILEPSAGSGGAGGLGQGGSGGSVSGTGGAGGDSECGCDAGDEDAGVEPDSGALR